MKHVIVFLFCLVLASCSLLKNNNKITNEEFKTTYCDTLYTDDSTKVGYTEVYNYLVSGEKKNKKNSIVVYRTYYILNSKEESNNIDTVQNLAESEPVYVDSFSRQPDRRPSSLDDKPIPVKESVFIKDKTTEKQLVNPSLGLVAYSVPNSMQVGKTYTVKLRISKENNKLQLINGNGVPIANANIDSKITIASIRVEPIMSAKLLSDSSKMLIQSTSTLVQDIEKEGFTEWEWRLTPIKGGDIFLKIMVSVITESEDGKITKDIPVYDEVINVRSNVVFTTEGFIKQYWQWIMTTIIIPFIVWFYNRKKKKEKS
jgi:hypothetical protein